MRRGHENDSREKTCLYPSSEPVPLMHLESTKRPIQLDASLLKAASPDQSNAQPRFAREFEDVGKPQRFDTFIYECLDAVLNQIEDMDANRWIPAWHKSIQGEEYTGEFGSLDKYIHSVLVSNTYSINATMSDIVQATFNDKDRSFIIKQAHTFIVTELSSFGTSRKKLQEEIQKKKDVCERVRNI